MRLDLILRALVIAVFLAIALVIAVPVGLRAGLIPTYLPEGQIFVGTAYDCGAREMQVRCGGWMARAKRYLPDADEMTAHQAWQSVLVTTGGGGHVVAVVVVRHRGMTTYVPIYCLGLVTPGDPACDTKVW